jgi:hypothetical protein
MGIAWYVARAWSPVRIGELAQAVHVDASEERARGPVIGHTRVLVADGGGEELDKAARGPLAGVGYRRRHDPIMWRRSDGPGGRNCDELVHARL